MRIEDGNIIPGIKLADFSIGMKRQEVYKRIGKDYVEHVSGDGGSVIILENAKIWISKSGFVRQIGVSKGFKGSYRNHIKIGSTLTEIMKIFDGYEYDEYTYNIVGVEGICFELEEIEEWNEMTAPIEWIFIYQI